jgi:calcium-translocating P-type ATPase
VSPSPSRYRLDLSQGAKALVAGCRSQHGVDMGTVANEPLIGLTDTQAIERRARLGDNRLPRSTSVPAWRRLAAELTHFFAVLLWLAAGLAFIAGLPQLTVAIALVVLINAVFAFAQERKAEQAAAAMQDMVPRTVLVRRNGRQRRLPADELVTDDIAFLAAGDRVPADGLVVDEHSLEIDTSIITGESVPVELDVGDGLTCGTFVVQGEGLMRVTAVGVRTRLAGLADLTRSVTRPTSPLALEMRRVVRTIATIAVSTGVAFLIVALVAQTDLQNAVTFAIGVTVALVPEALLPTVTLSLALGAQRIAKRHAVVRHLESVETLGSVTYICTDKTGTLTRNEMQVVHVWTPAGSVQIDGDGYTPVATIVGSDQAREAAERTALAARVCSSGSAVEENGSWVAHGDPMEAAIDALVRRLGLTKPNSPSRLFPFDPHRRRMSALLDDQVLVKGAADSVLPVCRSDTVNLAAADQGSHAMASAGLRVLAIACRSCTDGEPQDADGAEHDLTLLGLIGLSDPARPDAGRALAACREAGIKVSMVTGDHPATAWAIADQVGLAVGERQVVTGDHLPSDSRSLGELLDHDGMVVARVTPEQKLAITSALQSRGHVVAMTGDGVNDGPALQEADIGIAMGASGSDVAREASDLVLLDDDFSTIVATVEQGRGTFLNVRRFLTYHLTDNVAELFPLVMWALSGGAFPLALGVLQILALDLTTDTLSAVALGGEQPHGRVMRRPPVSGRLLSGSVARRAFGLLGPTEALLAMAAFVAVLIAGGWTWWSTPPPSLLAQASGAYFLTVVTAQSANAFACRSSTLTPRALGWTSNRLLLISVVVEFLFAMMLLLVAPIAGILGQAPPTVWGWALAGLAPAVLLVIDAADKKVRLRNYRAFESVTV